MTIGALSLIVEKAAYRLGIIMSLFWIALWVLLSTFIMGVFVWTTRALQDQKRAWKAFALPRGLSYRQNGYLQAAVISGKIDAYEFYLSSEERPTPDVRGRKFVSVIQFTLPIAMPAPGVVGSGDYKDFVRDLNTKDEMTLNYDGWEIGKVLAKSDDAARLTPWFTPDRMRVLDALIRQKGVSILFLFDTETTYLRLETGDPLLKTEQLEKMVAGILPMLKVLSTALPAG